MAPRRILKRFGFTAIVAIIVARFSRWLNTPCRLTGPDGTARDRAWLGSYGERVAADWLRGHRCTVLARNFKGPRRGEVDIVARDGKLLLFVEVKTRREGARIRPLDAVDKTKQRLMDAEGCPLAGVFHFRVGSIYLIPGQTLIAWIMEHGERILE